MHMDEAGFMAQLLREEALDVGAVVHQTSEADDVLLAEDPSAVVGSDGIAYGQKPHPRYYGAFAAFYDRHVRQRKRMTIAEAVAKMSTRTANILHLDDRGRVAPGQAADLVVFDPERYRACSTYEAPREFAEGVVHVLINGCPVYSREVFDDMVRAGRVIAL
jgi:N-acyl-D-aspartate/D-glutamate deacylase